MASDERGKVLVVDDDEAVGMVLSKMLQADGFSAETATTASAALDKLRQSRYEAILCDMWMPGMSGKDFYFHLKREFPQYTDRFVILTGDIFSEATWGFIDERRIPYLLKPLNLPELRKKITDIVGERPAPAYVEGQTSEQRRHRRIAIKARARVRKTKFATGGPDIVAAVNFSKEGLLFVTERNYHAGNELLICFPFTDSPDAPEQEGYVVRVEDAPSGKHYVAVAMGKGAAAAREKAEAPPEDRRRHHIIADKVQASPTVPNKTSNDAEVVEIKEKMERERQEARRLAEELADLKGTFEEVVNERDRLVTEEGRLTQELTQLTGAKGVTVRLVEQLKEQMKTLQQQISEAESYRHQATHDSLTGVWNRAAIFDLLKQELARAQRENTSVGVILADLDHFKSVNDNYGHLCGDAVLRETAQRISRSVRDYDAVGRYGGEEFVIVLPGCDTANALKKAENIRERLAEAPVTAGEHTIRTTASLGVAVGSNPEEMETLLGAADTALYRAKRNGRNRTETAEVAVKAAAPPTP